MKIRYNYGDKFGTMQDVKGKCGDDFITGSKVHFEGGNVLDRGFDTYEIPKLSWLPKIDCVILDRMDKPPKGGGEPSIIAVGAAVGNAIFDATGARLYQTPMTAERVLEALKKA
jgi:CO/xanthine dehydrogenase Mo-binding subunit